MKDDLLKAVELAETDGWDAAHRIVQRLEGNATADWIHAVLHKIEGDLDNSRYWYRRAGKMERVADDAHAELQAIRAALVNETSRNKS